METCITPLDAWIGQKIDCQAKLTRQNLETYQLEKLRETLDFVRARSQFYRQRLSRAPRDITGLSDLSQFPFTTSEDLRTQGRQFLCVSQDDIHRVVTRDTTGTTGQPKRLYFTQADQELTVDFFQAGMSTFTAPGDQVAIMLPCERVGSVGDLLAAGLRRLGANPLKYGFVRSFPHAAEMLRAENVDVLVGIPVQALQLARLCPGMKLKSVLLSTDYVPDAIARAIERRWECTVYNHYGMTEMGLGGGVECQAHRGYHLREADMYFEIVHPVSGEPVAEGELGEVVFSTLTRKGMPLIRYRTGDISRFIPGACPCGTALKSMERIRNRAGASILVGAGERITLSALDEKLFAIEAVLDYAAILIHGKAGNILKLKVVTGECMPADLFDEISQAVDAIPAISHARAAHELDLKIEFEKDRPVTPHPIKRTITEEITDA
jgi:phenylacetate-coenzyme A ligase PaaK-like adenylate-forming protein